MPLHTWLPDAMEGPTPVSALIHAATMVTAGVYLIARMHPLFEQAPAAADVGAVIGCVTLLIAGTIGLAVTDLKRVIAYSTMSQIGYMIMGVSAGAYVAGLFHLMTHAFFKALLFMAAGSVIAAMAGEQNLDKMGGFRRAMPFTFGCMVIGGLALAGIPPFSGFFSKDEILLMIGDRGGWHWILYVAGYVGAFLTAVYTWRMIFRAFFGEPGARGQGARGGPPAPRRGAHQPDDRRGRGHRRRLPRARAPHRRARGPDEDRDGDARRPRDDRRAHPDPEGHARARPLPRADVRGVGDPPRPERRPDRVRDDPRRGARPARHRDRLPAVGPQPGDRRAAARGASRRCTGCSSNKWYFDELIDLLVVRPFAWFGRFGQQTFERLFVNGTLVGGTTGVVRAGSAAVRAAQSGFLRYYAALLVLGMAVLTLYFLIEAA